MGMPFGVFAREHILTWHHVQNPYSFALGYGLSALGSEQKTGAIVFTLISAGVAAGASLVLNRSRTTLLVIAGGTALITFYAVTGYFKWCLTQPPGRRGSPPDGSRGEPRRGKRTESKSPYRPPSSSSARTIGFASPGSPHTIEDFRQKPDWLVPQRETGGGIFDAATQFRREKEREYFASLWKKIYEGGTAAASHWMNYSEQDDLLRQNRLSVEGGTPWEAFARFAQKHIQ
jgi:hypothetical protein